MVRELPGVVFVFNNNTSNGLICQCRQSVGRELPGVVCVYNNHTSNGLIWQHIIM